MLKCSWRRTQNTGCLKFNVSKIVIIFSEGRHLWALISQLLKGQIEKFWCLSYREFPEFFKNGPTFYSSSTQWPSLTIFHKWHFFLGHPVCVGSFVVNLSVNQRTNSKLHSAFSCSALEICRWTNVARNRVKELCCWQNKDSFWSSKCDCFEQKNYLTCDCVSNHAE